jgi:aryl-alcohol dehydrogenase-like predicted oxidoreductase
MACDKFDDQLFRIARLKIREIEMRRVRLGRNGSDVSEMGLGCMGMSGGYGPADDAESIAIPIHAALEAGVTMLDTGPVKNFLAYTLRRLGTDHVDLYQPMRLDPTVPLPAL